MRIPKLLIILMIVMNVPAGAAAKPSPKKESSKQFYGGYEPAVDDSAEFQAKLKIMYEKAEKSIQLLREQIIQNQSAPFLPDLFLQLADLLSEKSNILYYQHMEREKTADLKLDAKQKFNPIVTAQQEAIAVYQQILKEFPNFGKRDKVLYRLAISQKSIDESAAFVTTSERLLREYPKAKESMQVRLLLGQFYFEQQDFKSSADALRPAQDCEFPFERNAARYRLGLIRLNEEKFGEALKYFEKVATDEELKEGDNPLEVSIKTRTVNSNIKREALIDSVRAFTEVYKRNPDPIGFYNRVSPSEALFQETIEKLAYRYIFLKNETQAMGLLRVLSERVADPQKVVNIYQEVLLMIPPMQRIEVPAEEMQFLLAKYNNWISFFDVPENTKKEAEKFFETQIREMGTKSHDLGKSEFSTARKDLLYERARNFYHLYLGYFGKSKEAVKIATNLADVYYYQKNFLKSGDLYLRIYQGEFGSAADKEALLQNAILCFQKPAPNDFYEIVRNKGLLVKAIQSYMAFDAKKKRDPKLNFILIKSTYEQGLYDLALPQFISFIGSYPSATKEVTAAADIGLDYYNMRSDFEGLVDWSKKILAINTIPSALRTRLKDVQSKALMKKIDEDVKGKANYDAFSQGKIYFETALSMQDESMRSAVLEQALARSKSEKDVNTFIKAARAIAAAEKDSNKRAKILLGMGDQTLAIGRLYQTLGVWQEVLNDAKTPANIKKQVREKSLRLAIMLKDWPKIEHFSASKAGVSDTLRQNAQTQMGHYMDSAIQTSPRVLNSVPFRSLSAEELLPYFRGQARLPLQVQGQVRSSARNICAKQRDVMLCRWERAFFLPSKVANFRATLAKASTKLQAIEPAALKLSGLLREFRSVEDSGDPTLDIFTSLYKARAYKEFAQYLKRVGIANKQIAEVLSAKASESMQNAKQEYTQCLKIMNAASIFSPINKFCLNKSEPSLGEAFTWKRLVVDQVVAKDPKSPAIEDLQKKIFVDSNKPTSYLELSEIYLSGRDYRHAVAMATYGMSTFPQAKEDFAAILGCGLAELGLYSEAAFHLKSASDYKNIKGTCWSKLKARAE